MSKDLITLCFAVMKTSLIIKRTTGYIAANEAHLTSHTKKFIIMVRFCTAWTYDKNRFKITIDKDSLKPGIWKYMNVSQSFTVSFVGSIPWTAFFDRVIITTCSKLCNNFQNLNRVIFTHCENIFTSELMPVILFYSI